MDFFTKLFGRMANLSTKYDIGSLVASTIDALIRAEGFEVLDQPQSQIILDQNFHVGWRSGTFQRGGDILAAVNITELPAFEMLRTFCEEQTPEDMIQIHVSIDVLANAIIQQFETQSPEFRRLA